MKQSHKIGFLIATLLAAISWGIVIACWNKLPSFIPVHFGWNGAPDNWADKNIFFVTLIPVLQTIMLFAFLFLYKKPQYSNIPATLWLMSLGKKKRDHAFGLIRKMLVGITLWIGILFTYLTYAINTSAITAKVSNMPWVMIMILLLMTIWLIFWTAKVVEATKLAIKSKKKNR